MDISIIFGPVPSRRLGRSVGINNIPYKHCTYSCVYCQIGRTLKFEVNRRKYYDPEFVIESVVQYVEKTGEANIDYVTFVPDGEPTLDINLGKEINGIKDETKTKIAVITNGSLLFLEDVREDLMNADLVSIKVDAISEEIFKKINRPHPKLNLQEILQGILTFSEEYEGTIITESMFVDSINDSIEEITKIAEFLSRLRLHKAYIAVPTRPPAETWVKPATEDTILNAHEIFSKFLKQRAELLISYEGSLFENASQDPIQGLLSIISVHPMRIDYAYKFLSERGYEPKEVIEQLIMENKVVLKKYRNYEFVILKTKKKT